MSLANLGKTKSIYLDFRLAIFVANLGWSKLEAALKGIAFMVVNNTCIANLIKFKSVWLVLLYPEQSLSIENATFLATKVFSKLEQLYLKISDLQQLLPFIFHSATIKMIFVYSTTRLQYPIDFNIGVLNEQRQQLQNSAKVVIYLPDTLFYHLRHRHNQINFEKLELRNTNDKQKIHPFAVDFLSRLRHPHHRIF